MMTVIAALMLLTAIIPATAHRHAAFHNQRHIGRHLHVAAAAGLHQDEPILERRQFDSFTLLPAALATSLETLSTTCTYSYWTYSACSNAATTKIDSSQITTSTVLTVTASDQFHALQSLLTAGQSVQEDANSSASQALLALQTPVRVAASVTLVNAGATSSSTFTSIPYPAPTSSIPSSSTVSTSSVQTGGGWLSAYARPENGIALAIAAALLNA